jgi:hypothetical protein
LGPGDLADLVDRRQSLPDGLLQKVLNAYRQDPEDPEIPGQALKLINSWMKAFALAALIALFIPALGTAQASPATKSQLIVRVLDVGQGDATLIENGCSRVLIDG